jgi:hypothetical protein
MRGMVTKFVAIHRLGPALPCAQLAAATSMQATQCQPPTLPSPIARGQRRQHHQQQQQRRRRHFREQGIASACLGAVGGGSASHGVQHPRLAQLHCTLGPQLHAAHPVIAQRAHLRPPTTKKQSIRKCNKERWRTVWTQRWRGTRAVQGGRETRGWQPGHALAGPAAQAAASKLTLTSRAEAMDTKASTSPMECASIT